MIVVPRKVVPEVQQAGLPNVTQRIDTPEGMFGDGGKALMQGADALDKLGARLDARATDIQEEKNAARALELETMARREVMDAMYNPQTGLLAKKGGNALGVQAEMSKKMAEIRTKYGAIEGESQAVRDMLARSLSSIEQSALDTTVRHEFGEFQLYKSDQLAAVQATNLEDVALNFNDEKNFSAKWGENLKALTAQSTQEGWSQEVYGLKKTQLYSQMRSAQITAIVEQGRPDDILKAKEVFDEAQSRGMLTFDDSMKMRKIFDVAVPEALAKKTYATMRTQIGGNENIKKAAMIAAQNGIDPEFAAKVAMLESSGVADAQNPKSSAGGIFQFTDGTAQRYGLTDKMDVTASSKAFAEMTKNNKEYLTKQLGRAPTNAELYMAHQQGEGGAAKLLKNPMRLAVSIVGRDAVINNGGSEDMTAAEFTALWQAKYDRLALPYTQDVNPTQEDILKEAERLDAEYPGAGEELLALHKSTNERIEQARKQAQTEFLDTVMPRLYASNGDWTVLTAQEKAKAIELDVWKNVTSFNGVTNPAVGVAIALMAPEEMLSTDFSQAQWRTNLSQTDYESVLKKQSDMRNKPAARGEFRTTQSILAEAWRSTGKTLTDEGYYMFQSAAEDAFAAEIDARGGRALTTDEKRSIVSRLVLMGAVDEGGLFGATKKRVYQIDPDAVYTISGMEPEAAQSALNVLVSLNQEPSQNNLKKFIEKPYDFIKVPGYSDGDISIAVKALMRGGLDVNAGTVKSYLERKNKQAAQ